MISPRRVYHAKERKNNEIQFCFLKPLAARPPGWILPKRHNRVQRQCAHCYQWVGTAQQTSHLKRQHARPAYIHSNSSSWRITFAAPLTATIWSCRLGWNMCEGNERAPRVGRGLRAEHEKKGRRRLWFPQLYGSQGGSETSSTEPALRWPW